MKTNLSNGRSTIGGKHMISRLGKSFVWIPALFLLLFMTGNSLGQQVVVNRDADGKWQGPYASFHANGAKKGEATFKDGRLTGVYSTYHDNGQLSMRGTTAGSRYNSNEIDHPIPTGLWVTYFKDGKKSAEYLYGEKGQLDGKTILYHTNGKPRLEAIFKAGRLVGPYSTYHDNGKLQSQGASYGSRYNDNEVDHPMATGLWTYYFKDGAKQAEYLYEKNNLEGRSIEYHANGKPHIDATLKAGRLTGLYSQYHNNGQLHWQGTAIGNEWELNKLADPRKTGLWITYSPQGAVTAAVVYDKNKEVSRASYSLDTATGQTTIVATNPDGTRNVTKVDKNGIVGAAGSTGSTIPATSTTPAAKIDDAADFIGMQTDPRTGQTTTSRRNPDGTTTTYTGTRRRDTDGTERLTEMDANGNRIETSVKPDGTITEVRTRPGKGEKRTTTTPDGRVTTVERDVAGRTRTSVLDTDGSVVSTIRNSDGQVTGTTRQRPDGLVEQTDTKGNKRMIIRDPNGTTTTVSTDASGNVTTTTVGPDGKVGERDANIVGPREPGRTYYEQTLRGTHWDDLSPRLRSQMANSERQMQASQVQRAEYDAAEVRRKTEEARLAAQGAAATEASKNRYEKMRTDQEAADRAAAALKAKFAKRNEIEAAYQTGRTLDRDYRAAIARGDKKEAIRILALQDENAQKTATLLENSPEEQRAMEQYSDARTRISNEINARAYAAAERTLAANTVVDNAREVLTKPGQYLSMGAGVQQETAYATRLANREKVLAQARLQEIDRDLNDPTITPERRSILQDEREMAVLKENGANELLTSNSMVTAAGYTIDGVLMLSGAKLAQLGTNAVRATATAVGGVLTRRAAAQAATTATTGTAGKLAGQTTVTVANDAGRTIAMTAAERQAMLDARVASSMDEFERVVGNDILPGPAAPRIALNFTESELARLHRPGGHLTAAEIAKKAELYMARSSARNSLNKALRDPTVPDATLNALEAEVLRLNTLIEQAQIAGRNLP